MNRLVVAAAMCALASVASSHGLDAQGIRAGIKAGAARSEISGNDTGDSRWGMAGGAYLGLKLGGTLIQPEVLFVQRRASLGATTGNLEQDYMDVAVLVGTSFGIIVKPMIYLAPVASFETSCGISTSMFDSECTSFDTKSAVLSGAVGAGLDIGVFSVDVRYTLGLSDSRDDLEGKWRTLTVMAGFGLSLGM